MKPNLTIAEGVIENRTAFNSPFFAPIRMHRAASQLALTDEIAKDYLFPTLYTQSWCASAIFRCDARAAQALLPHPALRPIGIGGGQTLLVISCYQYHVVHQMAPYYEIALALPVVAASRPAPPILPLVLRPRNAGYYVFSMPVTSQENQIRGRRIWGLPKVVEEISFEEDRGRCVISAHDAAGTPYLTLRVPTQGQQKVLSERHQLFSVLDGALVTSTTSFRAPFQVNTNLRTLLPRQPQGADAITLGTGAEAEALRSLNIRPQPLQTRFTKELEACFDLPQTALTPNPSPSYAGRG